MASQLIKTITLTAVKIRIRPINSLVIGIPSLTKSVLYNQIKQSLLVKPNPSNQRPFRNFYEKGGFSDFFRHCLWGQIPPKSRFFLPPSKCHKNQPKHKAPPILGVLFKFITNGLFISFCKTLKIHVIYKKFSQFFSLFLNPIRYRYL